MLIQIIDPDRARAEFLSEPLTAFGHDCYICATSAEFFSQVRPQATPHLALIFHAPPEVDALHVLEKIREKNRQTLVAIVGPDPSVEFVLSALNRHSFALFIQPPGLAEILQLVDEVEKEISFWQSKEDQHSRLAMEYSRLRQRLQDIRKNP